MPALLAAVLLAGWGPWPLAPKGCDLEVPDTLAAVAPLKFSACPFQKEGCLATGASFAAETGWGFAGRLEARSRFAAITRAAANDGTFDTVVLEDGAPVAAFRQHVGRSGCVLGSVSLDASGDVTVPVLRADEESAPLVLMGPAKELMRTARRAAQFGGKAAVLPLDVARTGGSQLVLHEHGGRFSVRDLETHATQRSKPGAYEPQPTGGDVLYTARHGERASVWSLSSGAVLDAPGVSFDGFVVDGHDAAWLRSSGSEVELWAATVEKGALQNARPVTRLAPGPLPLLALGEGHAVLWRSGKQVRVVRLADGDVTAVPAVPTLQWDGGPGGIAVASGELWARASLERGAGNDYRLIARFRLTALAPFDARP